MQTARDWAKARGMEVIHGPLGFTDIDHQGMLVEGFDELDLFITIYNAPYYMSHMLDLGFEKDIDWVECQLRLDDEKSERLKKISAYLSKNTAFQLLEFKRKKDMMVWAEDVFDLYNTAYAPLYGTTELTDKQIKMYIKTFLGFVNPDFVKVVVDADHKLAAFALAMPSLSKAMQKSKGKLLPFGFLHILKAIHKNDILDLYLIAVKPEYQNSGINGLMLNSVMQTAKKYGMTHAETGPMLESNLKVQSQWKFFEVRQHRRRRIWKSSL
jgi:GNAT superfamily N-acetyltransferase